MEREKLSFTSYAAATDADARKVENRASTCAGAISIKKMFTCVRAISIKMFSSLTIEDHAKLMPSIFCYHMDPIVVLTHCDVEE